MNRRAQAGFFGILLLLVVFFTLFVYITPFLNSASDSMDGVLSGFAGLFFGNWAVFVFLIFMLVILWRIAGG